MNSIQPKRRSEAFTLIELLCVIGIIGILAALLMPALSRGKTGAQRVQCVGNLKQLGVAFLNFAHDHKDRFPMQTPSAEGGTLEFVQGGYQVSGPFYFSFRHFAALSNELITPKPLLCPAEELRAAAESFARFGNDQLSYFVGVSSEPQRPNSVLAGDRNVTNVTAGGPTLVRQPYGSAIRWTAELHRYKGNLLFADGHVEERNERELAAAGSSPIGDLLLPTSAGGAVAMIPASTAVARQSPKPPGAETRQEGSKLTENSEPRNAMPVYAKTLPAAAEGVQVPAATSGSPESSSVSSVPVQSDAPLAISMAAATNTMEAESKWKNPFLWLLYLLLLLLLAVLAAGIRRQFRRES